MSASVSRTDCRLRRVALPATRPIWLGRHNGLGAGVIDVPHRSDSEQKPSIWIFGMDQAGLASSPDFLLVVSHFIPIKDRGGLTQF